MNQHAVLNLLKDISSQQALGVLLITHNISLVEQFADYLVVLENGTIAESGDVPTFLAQPKSRAGQQLLENRISGSDPASLIRSLPEENSLLQHILLEANQLVVSFVQSSNTFDTNAIQIKALSDVNIALQKGIVTGITGESGSGKSTLIRCLAGLTEPQQGYVLYDKKSLSELKIGETSANGFKLFFKTLTFL
jgi:peptide/nickel transport system ATP-binding protein